MPKILINKKSTQLIFEVKNYTPSDENKHHMWCVVRIGIHNDHINFDKTDNFLMNYEIEELADWLYKILNGEKVKSLDEDFYKPDIHFTAILPWNVGSNEKDNNLVSADFDPLLLIISIEFRTKGSYLGEKWTTILNEQEIREFYNQLQLEIDCLADLAKKKDERYLCAIATYQPDFGKKYSFFVQDKIDDAIWYVDGSYNQVYVDYFQELAIDELPVDYQKMKKIIPVNKKSHIFKKIVNGDVNLSLIIDDLSIYCYISFPSNKYIFNFEKLSIEEIDMYLKTFGDLYIEGPKWCGKTWTSRFHSKSEFLLADPRGNFNNKKTAKLNPDLALQGDYPRLIDEWQEVPALWDAVRGKVDSSILKGQFILTGSTTIN